MYISNSDVKNQYDKVFFATVSSNGPGYWSDEAKTLGYRSTSEWKKLGRKPKDVAIPSMVVREVKIGVGVPLAPIMRDLGDDRFEYAETYHFVYLEEDTDFFGKKSYQNRKKSKEVNAEVVGVSECEKTQKDQGVYTPNNLCNTDTRYRVMGGYSSNVGGFVSETELKGKHSKDLKVYKKRDLMIEFKEYSPENFDFTSVPKELRGGLKYLLHILYINRTIRRLGSDFFNIHSETFREIVWNGRAVRHWAVNSGLVESDKTYKKGEKSTGYRLCEKLRNTKFIMTRRTSRTIIRNLKRTQLKRSSIGKWLEQNLMRINAVITDDMCLEDQRHLELINAGSIATNPEDEFGQRFHSSLTNLRSDLKKCLRVDSKPLWQIDIKNSQPLFLASLLESEGVECESYSEVVQAGTFYETLAAITGLTRNEQKHETLVALFSKNTNHTATKRALCKAFPEVGEYIQQVKQENYTELARQLQREESTFIIRTVCARIRKEHPKMFVATIHDSVLTNSPENAMLILDVMADEFSKINLRPKLEVEAL